MRSRANIKTHPIHPILVTFPIAFFTGAFIADLMAVISSNNDLRTTATYLIIGGIVGGLLAATAGIIDYVHTVPPKSSAKKRAAKHGMLNTTVLSIFAVSLYLRSAGQLDHIYIVALEFVAIVMMGFAGWMGGTLVYRNQIGVDIRYADAGKWKELEVDAESGEIEVAQTNELTTNQMKLIHLKDKRIVLAKTEEGYVAFDDRCSHKGASLAAGAMICGTVQCPWHGTHFDVKTGAVKAGPAKEGINTYPIMEKLDKVYIVLAKNNA